MQHLIDWWMHKNGSLRADRFITMYVFYEPQIGGYGHLAQYVIELRERRQTCAVCQSPFLATRNVCAQNYHAPHESYDVVKKVIGYDLEALAIQAME